MMARSKRAEDSIGPVPSPRRRRCAVRICDHPPWDRRLRFPSCPFVSFVDILEAGKRNPHRPPSPPAPAAVHGPDLRSSPWGRRLRLPSCPFVSFVDILKAGKRNPHRPPYTPRAGGSARSRFAVISLGSPNPLSFVPLVYLRGYPESWPKEAASPPFHTPRRRRSADQICDHPPGIAVSAFLRAPLCPSWISSKLAKGSRIAPLHTPRRRQCPVQICGHLPGIAVSAFLRAPLCPSWISSKLAKGIRIAPLHTPRRRRCAVQICGHLPGIAVSAFLRAPLCPSWISSKLAKGSRIRIAPPSHVSAFHSGLTPLCPSWISSKLAKGSRIAPLHTPPTSRATASELSQSTEMLPCPLPYPVQTL